MPERYAAYVKAAESIDTQRLVGFYVRLYPPFQQAHVEPGYPRGYFNDRLIAVIDHCWLRRNPGPSTWSSRKVKIPVRRSRAGGDVGRAEGPGQIGIDNELRPSLAKSAVR
jgi:hypothetical protein